MAQYFHNWRLSIALKVHRLGGLCVTILTSGMVAWASGSRRRGRSMLTFITAKRAVLSSLTCAGLMATVLGIVNRWSGLRFHVPAPLLL